MKQLHNGAGSALGNVNWTSFIFGIITLAATVVVWDLYDPVEKPFLLYDASLSRPIESVTFSVPITMVVSIILALIQLAVAEFVLMRGLRTRSLQVTHFIQALVHLFCVFWWQSFIQQFFASTVGKQRPSFLAECNLKPEAFALADEVPSYNSSSSFRPHRLNRSFCSDQSQAADASKSFFSGHASSATVVVLFAMMHFYYTLTVRAAPRWRDASPPPRTQRWCWGFMRGCLLYLMCGQLFWFLAVGMSRYKDNKHHVEDIVTGFYVGTIFAVLGFWDWVGIERELVARINALSSSPLESVA